MTDTLTTLADACGIADAYHDIWGGHHLTSTYTRQALLTAMHFPPDAVVANPDKILRELEARAWQQRLPPVVVVRSGETIRMDLTLSEAESKHKWHWSITLENDDRLAGEIVPATLQKMGQQEARSRYTLELPAVDTLGYHSLQLQKKGATASLSIPLIVVPQRCHQPEAIQHGGRIWGLTVQLYGVRSQRNWGIGDFTDLAQLVELTGQAGGQIVGVNPLHALFPDNPAHISPYSPSQRGFVNVLYLDVEAVPEFATCAPAQRRLASADFQARLKAVRAGRAGRLRRCRPGQIRNPRTAVHAFSGRNGKACRRFRRLAYRPRRGTRKSCAFCSVAGTLSRHQWQLGLAGLAGGVSRPAFTRRRCLCRRARRGRRLPCLAAVAGRRATFCRRRTRREKWHGCRPVSGSGGRHQPRRR